MTTIYYASITNPGTGLADVDHAGTSSTAADVIEIRWGNGTYVPTQREGFMALENFRRWLIQRGLDGAGANLPPNSG